jgi:FkbM family methyltransferase
MRLFERLHFLHRRLRYAYRTEPDTICFIRDFVDRGDRVLDIGANKGIVTWFLARATGPQGEVLAFEPQPELAPALEDIKRTYGLSQVEIVQAGLADAPGVLPLFRERAGATGTLVEAGKAARSSIEIELVRLDDFLGERAGAPPVRFVKCDVDGFERQVFAGATRLLSTDRPLLLIEIGEDDLSGMRELLADFGYRDFWFYFKGSLLHGAKTEDVGYRHANARYRNFLFVHDLDPRKSRLA